MFQRVFLLLSSISFSLINLNVVTVIFSIVFLLSWIVCVCVLLLSKMHFVLFYNIGVDINEDNYKLL